MAKVRTIVVGSRGSRLALAQTEEVIQQLSALFPDTVFEFRRIKTQGDVLNDAPLPQIGGKGLFVKELEVALLEKEIDLAVHSYKDLPTELAPGLEVAAITRRQDARDALISRSGAPLSFLEEAALVGTSSLRRMAQLSAYRPDLDFVNLRGNLDTRLRKVAEGVVEAAVVAAAGMLRLGWQDKISDYIPTYICVPAVGQGALAVELRQEDEELKHMVASIDHTPSRQAVAAERALLKSLGGGCHAPIGGYAEVRDGQLNLQGMVASPQGDHLLRSALTGDVGAPEELGRRLAERFMTMGAGEVLARAAS